MVKYVDLHGHESSTRREDGAIEKGCIGGETGVVGSGAACILEVVITNGDMDTMCLYFEWINCGS